MFQFLRRIFTNSCTDSRCVRKLRLYNLLQGFQSCLPIFFFGYDEVDSNTLVGIPTDLGPNEVRVNEFFVENNFISTPQI